MVSVGEAPTHLPNHLKNCLVYSDLTAGVGIRSRRGHVLVVDAHRSCTGSGSIFISQSVARSKLGGKATYIDALQDTVLAIHASVCATVDDGSSARQFLGDVARHWAEAKASFCGKADEMLDCIGLLAGRWHNPALGARWGGFFFLLF